MCEGTEVKDAMAVKYGRHGDINWQKVLLREYSDLLFVLEKGR